MLNSSSCPERPQERILPPRGGGPAGQGQCVPEATPSKEQQDLHQAAEPVFLFSGLPILKNCVDLACSSVSMWAHTCGARWGPSFASEVLPCCSFLRFCHDPSLCRGGDETSGGERVRSQPELERAGTTHHHHAPPMCSRQDLGTL